MKRILLLSLFLVLSTLTLQATPWAELDDVVKTRESRPERDFNKPEEVTVLPKIVQGQPLRVAVSLSSSISASEEDYQAAKDVVSRAYNDWFKNAVEQIEDENRAREFDDVLPLLKRGVQIEFVEFRGNEFDIVVQVVSGLLELADACGCYGGCDGCAASIEIEGKILPAVIIKGGHYSTVVHELGHTLGIADAYEGGYEKNASPTHRSEQRIESSVMGNGRSLSPDDADGLINMIDSWTIYAAKKQYPNNWQEHISPRILNGWNSLLRSQLGSAVDRYRLGTSVKLLPQTQQAQQPQPVLKQERKAAASASRPATKKTAKPVSKANVKKGVSKPSKK